MSHHVTGKTERILLFVTEQFPSEHQARRDGIKELVLEACVGYFNEVCPAPTCGENHLFPSARLGCGEVILDHKEVFRCVECGTPFHKHCLHKHCKNELEEARSKIAELESRLPRIGGERTHELVPSIMDGGTHLVHPDLGRDGRLT